MLGGDLAMLQAPVFDGDAIGGSELTRILDKLHIRRGMPQVIRTDNGKEFAVARF